MPASSNGWSVNFGPAIQAEQTAPLQERTRNWYALPVAVPMARRTRVLVAEAGVSGTAGKGPSDAVVAPVAISSCELVPVPVHVRSTGSVLFWIGDRSAIGSLKTAARLCTGTVADGVGLGGVLAESAIVWSVLFAASSPNERFAWRVPYVCGLNATFTVTLLPAARVDPFVPAGTVRTKSSRFRPAMYARSRCSAAVPLLVSVTSC